MIPTMADTLQFLGLRKKSYQSMFGKKGMMGEPAMKDLANFCHAFKTTAVPNHDLSMVLQGRREVWLHICEYLELEPEELAVLRGAVAAGE